MPKECQRTTTISLAFSIFPLADRVKRKRWWLLQLSAVSTKSSKRVKLLVEEKGLRRRALDSEIGEGRIKNDRQKLGLQERDSAAGMRCDPHRAFNDLASIVFRADNCEPIDRSDRYRFR